MKVNFNVYFKDFDGSVLLIDKKPQCMGVIVSQCLFNGTGFRPSGNIQTDNEKKLHAYSLCMRIMGSDADVDLTSEDAVLIKEAVTGLTPVAHGRFGRPEEVAKIGKREDAVRLGGKNLHHSAHALVAADFVHGGIAPLSVVEYESRCT